MLRRSLAEGRPYGLAFVDVRMPPGWDGLETISRFWSLYPALQAVVCTAYSDYSWEEMRAKLGQNDSLVVLKKPFDNIEVQQLAYALTRKWRLAAQAALKLEELQAMVAARTADLHRSNELLTRSEEKFSKAFSINPVAMAIFDLADRRCVEVNERMLQLVGRRRDEFLGQTSDLATLGRLHIVDDWWAKLARNEPVSGHPLSIPQSGGKPREVLASLAPVLLFGKGHGLLLLHDVTEQNVLERKFYQAQKMEVVGQLAAGVAHDLNNSLTVVQGYSDLLQQPDGSTNPKFLQEIQYAVRRASELTCRLLAFSRKHVVQLQRLNLNDVVEQSLHMSKRLLGEHIDVRFVRSGPSAFVEADRTLLDQIVLNLAINARDAMEKGGTINASIECVKLEGEAALQNPEAHVGNYVRLRFSDTGCGMDASVLARIFEPFFTTKPPGKGTGLGLSTVFGIVRQHHGWIEVFSEVNKGTTFHLYFPAAAHPQESASGSNRERELVRGTERILVVEDENVVRDLLNIALKKLGYQVLSATSGGEALSIYRSTSETIDLVLTDLVMPGGIMGWELAEQLHVLNPTQKVAFISGYRPSSSNGEELTQGHRLLSKPFSLQELSRFVKERLAEPDRAPSVPPALD